MAVTGLRRPALLYSLAKRVHTVAGAQQSAKTAGSTTSGPIFGLELSHFLTTANLDTLDRQPRAPYPGRLEPHFVESPSLGACSARP
jgi:hypothetical protein